MRSVYCCSLRTCVLAVGIVFLACQTSLLVLNFLLMNDVERHVETAFEWFEEGVDSGAGDGEEMIGSALKEQVIRVSERSSLTFSSRFFLPYDAIKCAVRL